MSVKLTKSLLRATRRGVDQAEINRISIGQTFSAVATQMSELRCRLRNRVYRTPVTPVNIPNARIRSFGFDRLPGRNTVAPD